MWRTAARTGSVRALDLEDFDSEEPCLMFRHRPETGTPLKNKERGERHVAVDSYYSQVIQDYIENHRYDKKDEHGRRTPPYDAPRVRPVASTIRNYCYLRYPSLVSTVTVLTTVTQTPANGRTRVNVLSVLPRVRATTSGAAPSRTTETAAYLPS